MNREERLSSILDLLGSADSVQVAEIVDTFGVSPATARRDLDVLASRQLLNRTRGGATAISVAYDLPLRYKREQHADAKQRIAAKVMDLVPPGARVGLTGGSTCTTIASELGQRADLVGRTTAESLTVVTNAVNIAAQLVIRPHIRVVMTGGVIHARSYELVGPYSDLMLERITLDLAFVGINGFDVLNGPMVHDDREARVNGLMASRAERAWLVADSSKVGHRALASIGRLDMFYGLVTDNGISARDRSEERRVGKECRTRGWT